MLTFAERLQQNKFESDGLRRTRQAITNYFDEYYGANHRDMFDALPVGLTNQLISANSKKKHLTVESQGYSHLDEDIIKDLDEQFLRLIEKFHSLNNSDDVLPFLDNDGIPLIENETYRNYSDETSHVIKINCALFIHYYGRYMPIELMYQKVGHHIAECKITPWIKNEEYIPALKREGFNVDLQPDDKMVISWDKK